MLNRLRRFLRELKRRHVYRVAVVYLMSGWLLIEVLTTVGPHLDLPESVLTLVIVLVGCGFPLALVLAWAYDLTPQGVRRAVPARGEAGGERDEEPPGLELPAGTDWSGAGPPGAGGGRGWVLRAMGFAGLLLGIVLWFTVLRPLLLVDQTEDAAPASDGRSPGVGAAGGNGTGELPARTVAVLPMRSTGREEPSLFAEGLAEELILTLMRSDALRVISPTSVMQYRNGIDQTIAGIARELRAGTVVEGRVQHEGGQRRVDLYVTRMQDGATTTRVLLHRYVTARGDAAFRAQRQVARSAAERLAGELEIAPPPPPPAPPPGDRAYRLRIEALYSDGRRHWNERTVESVTKSIALLEASLAEDPGYAQAHAALAESWILMAYLGARPPREAYPRALEYAREALDQRGDLAAAYSARAYVRYAYQWDWAAAEDDFHAALEANPSYATAHHWYGWFLAARGRFEEARDELQQAARLDPHSLPVRVSLGHVDYVAGSPEAAIERYRAVLDGQPGYRLALIGLGLALTEGGEAREAMPPLEEAASGTGPRSPAADGALGYALARAGETERARERIERLRERPEDGHVAAGEVARVYAGLGDGERAIAWLEKALERRDETVATLEVDPAFDSLHDLPGFAGILAERERRAGRTTAGG